MFVTPPKRAFIQNKKKFRHLQWFISYPYEMEFETVNVDIL
jgi:hypothetical protein